MEVGEHMLVLLSLSYFSTVAALSFGLNTQDRDREARRRTVYEQDMRRSAPQEEYCPLRNEEAAKAKGMKCMTKCLSDNSCQNKRKLCLCDDLCGMSCIRPEKECTELPDPPNGQVHLSGRHFQD